MQVAVITLSNADKEHLQNRIAQLHKIGLQQAMDKQDYIPTQDAAFRIQNWLMIDSIINKKEVHNENY